MLNYLYNFSIISADYEQSTKYLFVLNELFENISNLILSILVYDKNVNIYIYK